MKIDQRKAKVSTDIYNFFFFRRSKETKIEDGEEHECSSLWQDFERQKKMKKRREWSCIISLRKMTGKYLFSFLIICYSFLTPRFIKLTNEVQIELGTSQKSLRHCQSYVARLVGDLFWWRIVVMPPSGVRFSVVVTVSGGRGGKRRASSPTNWLELARAGVPVSADDSLSMEGKSGNRRESEREKGSERHSWRKRDARINSERRISRV